MRFINLLILALVLFSCKKDNPDPVVVDQLSNGMLVLNEGLFQQNNSSVSWVSFANGAVSNGFFEAKTQRALGDTGNDMKRYGGKVYIVVNVSSTIEVLNAKNFTAIKQIQMQANGIAKQPRSIAFAHGKAYVSCFDGFVDVIDTASLNVIQRIPVGLNPDGLAAKGNFLYVSNSGGLNAPTMDSTLSVIDLTSHTETERITVGLNPGGVTVDDEGDIYVIRRGNYGSIPSRLVRIDGQDHNVIETLPFDATSLAVMGQKFLVSYFNFSTSQSSVGLFNPLTETMESPDFIDLSQVSTLYGVHYHAGSNRIYCLDAMSFTNSGYVRVFSTAGNYLASYHVGLNPSKIVFYE
jgi:YVTN family beta-propeller protein